MTTPSSYSPIADDNKILEEGEKREEDTSIMEEGRVMTNDCKETDTSEAGPVAPTSGHFEEKIDSEREEGEIVEDGDVNETVRPSASDRSTAPPQLVLVPSPSRIHGDEPLTQEGSIGTPVKSSSPSTRLTESPPVSFPPTLSSEPQTHRSGESPSVAIGNRSASGLRSGQSLGTGPASFRSRVLR